MNIKKMSSLKNRYYIDLKNHWYEYPDASADAWKHEKGLQAYEYLCLFVYINYNANSNFHNFSSAASLSTTAASLKFIIALS